MSYLAAGTVYIATIRGLIIWIIEKVLKKNPNKQTQVALNAGELSGKWDLNRISYVDWTGIIVTEKNPSPMGPCNGLTPARN